MSRMLVLLTGAGLTVTMPACSQAPGSRAVPLRATPSIQAAVQPDKNFAVSAPPDMSSGGGAVLQPPKCSLASIRTAASTRESAEGIVGLITLTKPGCTINVDAPSVRLLGADGRRLVVSNSAGNPVNPAASKRPDVAEYSGRVRFGFAWSGAYCGPEATAVELMVNAQPLRIPLHTASPRCLAGGHSELIPGAIAGPGAAVEPAPLGWRSLQARVVLPESVGQGPLPLTVVLTNSGSRAISLADPCPVYNATTSVRASGSESVYGGGGDLCRQAVEVAAGRSVTLKLGTLRFPAFSDLPRTPIVKGDPVTVTWTIAGGPLASATTKIG